LSEKLLTFLPVIELIKLFKAKKIAINSRKEELFALSNVLHIPVQNFLSLPNVICAP
jgi:hypothetical protein